MLEREWENMDYWPRLMPCRRDADTLPLALLLFCTALFSLDSTLVLAASREQSKREKEKKELGERRRKRALLYARFAYWAPVGSLSRLGRPSSF